MQEYFNAPHDNNLYLLLRAAYVQSRKIALYINDLISKKDQSNDSLLKMVQVYLVIVQCKILKINSRIPLVTQHTKTKSYMNVVN